MFKKFCFFILSLFVFLLILPATINAIELRGGEDLNYSSDKVFNGNTFIAGSNINFEAVVEGDLFIVGSEVDLDEAEILGDLYIGAGNVTLRDIKVEDIRLGSGTLIIKGSKISGDLMIGSAQVIIDENTEISGSIYAGAGTLNLEGIIGEDIRMRAGDIVIDAQIGGQVKVNADSLNIKKNSQINGKVIYTYGKEGEKATVSKDAELSGGFSQKQTSKAPAKKSILPNLTSFLYGLLMYWIVGLIMVLFVPVCMRRTAEILEKRPWASLGWGALALFVTPIALMILLMTFLGIPLALIGLGFYLLLLYIAKIFTATYIGIKILKSEKKTHAPIWEMALGVLIIFILGAIPYIGGWVRFLAILFGLGILILRSIEVYREMRKKAQI